MLVEEYRLHTSLFGSRRFLAFPLLVAVIVAVGVWLLDATGTELPAVVAGLHALVAFFGLQVGTLGLVGRDAMRNLLGDTTLLVFSARTLPISWRRLLGTFLLKDLVYYGAVFLTPLVAGFAPIAAVGGFEPAQLALLWGTLVATFALGASGSLALVGLGTRTVGGLLAAVAVLVATALVWPSSVVAATPYAVYADPSPRGALVAAVPIAAAVAVGLLLFEPATGGGTRRITTDRYRTLRRVPGVDAVTARSLLELARSSGSVWKVAFSIGVLFVVTALLLDRVAAATGLSPAPGIAFGTLLGLGTFTTYNWLTQFDDPREYLRYPIGMAAVFRGKLRAHLALAVPTGSGYLALAVFWYPPVDLLVGVVVFPLVAVYVAGLTAVLTGLSATELLFDTAAFAVFGAGLAVLAVPLLVAALAASTAPLVVGVVAVWIAVVFGVVGVVLARRAGPRWERRLREVDS